MLLMQNLGPNTGTGFVRVKQSFKKEGNNMFIDCIDIDQDIHASPMTPPYFINLLLPFFLFPFFFLFFPFFFQTNQQLIIFLEKRRSRII